jgi:hypothetical protein
MIQQIPVPPQVGEFETTFISIANQSNSDRLSAFFLRDVTLLEPPTIVDDQPSEISSNIRTLTFNDLSQMLLTFETQNGYSTVEMFQRYMNGEFDDIPSIENWFDTFFLYVGTNQIRDLCSA